MEKCLELELPNGNRIVRTFDLRKIYNINQKVKTHIKLTRSFPFIRLEHATVTCFRYQTEFELVQSSGDERYCINCSLNAFLDMIGMHAVSWDESVLKSAIRHG